jgi:hypothetical protein
MKKYSDYAIENRMLQIESEHPLKGNCESKILSIIQDATLFGVEGSNNFSATIDDYDLIVQMLDRIKATVLEEQQQCRAYFKIPAPPFVRMVCSNSLKRAEWTPDEPYMVAAEVSKWLGIDKLGLPVYNVTDVNGRPVTVHKVSDLKAKLKPESFRAMECEVVQVIPIY